MCFLRFCVGSGFVLWRLMRFFFECWGRLMCGESVEFGEFWVLLSILTSMVEIGLRFGRREGFEKVYPV